MTYNLSEIYMPTWLHTRQMTYDYLDVLDNEQLALTLPFPESQALYYQFWCMVGAHESYLRKLEHGAWQGFARSLNEFEEVTVEIIKTQMQKSDVRMNDVLQGLNLDSKMENGDLAHLTVLQMIKHENHHHGQLINYMYCHHLPIPDSWADEWALSR